MENKRFLKCVPHLPVNNLRATLDYYREILGFTDEWTFNEKDGGISRDELRMLFAEDPAFTADMNNKHRRLPLLWFVDDVENIYSEFKSRNIELADELKLHPYGLREFAFIDINGYYIRIAESS
jgi:uncharacterized glyoxalase superfamily protein PhnB